MKNSLFLGTGIFTLIIYLVLNKITYSYQSELIIENFNLFNSLRNLGQGAFNTAASTVCRGYINERNDAINERNQLQVIRNQLEQQKAQLERQIAQYQQLIIELHRRQLQLINTASNNINVQLADKNRLLSTVNSNIQTSYTKLSEINDRINTITQDIHQNNAAYEIKEKIEKTMKAIILILILLLIVMICYYASDIAKDRFPGVYNSFTSSLAPTSSGFKFT